MRRSWDAWLLVPLFLLPVVAGAVFASVSRASYLGEIEAYRDDGSRQVDGALVHPRLYGTFPRKIRRYAIERGNLSVESAIRSATSLPAQILGIRSRGLVHEGFHADLVVMDLDAVRDTATFFEPHAYAEGIVHVIVGGAFVVEDSELTWSLPGTVVTPADGRAAPTLD